jgi:hypothetical protein
MKSGVLVLALGTLILTDASVQAQRRRGDQDAARFGWLSNLESGKAEARKSGKPIMVVLRCVP